MTEYDYENVAFNGTDVDLGAFLMERGAHGWRVNHIKKGCHDYYWILFERELLQKKWYGGFK